MSKNARYRRRHVIPGIWLPGWLIDPRRRCTHTRRRNIYGDEINLAGGRRSRCLDCGRLLPDLAPGAEGAEDRPKFPGLHDRPDTGKECHYLAVTMPHGWLFCNKCGWAEGAEDRGQSDG